MTSDRIARARRADLPSMTDAELFDASRPYLLAIRLPSSDVRAQLLEHYVQEYRWKQIADEHRDTMAGVARGREIWEASRA